MRSSRSLFAALVWAAVVTGLAAAPARAQDEARGELLFDLCSSCHAADGGGNRIFLAPAIAGMSEWYVLTQLQKFRQGLRGRHFDDLSGMRMRPMALTLRSEEDVQAVARYVASLPPAPPAPQVEGGDPERGKALYVVCATCHGAEGEGVQQMNGGPIAHTSDWYLLDQLMKFRAGVRGADPRDPIAIMMRPMALTLPDEQAIKDVVAYIVSLAE